MSRRAWLRPLKRKNGTIAQQVRWREIINGASRMCSECFDDYKSANAFLQEVRRRLDFVTEAKGLMSDLMKPAGAIATLVEEFVVHIRATGDLKSDSVSPEKLQYFIDRMAKEFNWTSTSDITAKEMEKVLTYFQNHPTTKFNANRALLRFLTWLPS